VRRGVELAEINHVKPKYISLKDHPQIKETWVHARIKEDPSILNLGDLVFVETERRQPKAGRLDILLKDPETGKKYEVEVQLGPMDESHIIRTIEYWDYERKRSPRVEHAAVLIAEDVTGRFINVIHLLNGTIPLIAIKMIATKHGDGISLHFTTVLDETAHREEYEAEEDIIPADRPYWEKHANPQLMDLLDKCIGILKDIDANLAPHWTKGYVGLEEYGVTKNFISFSLLRKKNQIKIWVSYKGTDMWEGKLSAANINVHKEENGSITFFIKSEDINKNKDLLKELFKKAYDKRDD
jgi:hypothetical protein